ncbi:hypothetical protein RRG08_008571 [Elysia crispata]|uniref:Uncharacterized protein n=1 Tax=Elysia crispata TaxID=231223 RepID=A0AAE0Y131_9GAST|nr:hypothetical protein RRG08_008571 [Elysia crispata]
MLLYLCSSPSLLSFQSPRDEGRHISVSRSLQGVFFVPFFLSIGVSMLLIFGSRALLWPPQEDGESFMSAHRVFLTFGLFNVLKVPLTIFIPFTVQYIAEMSTVGARLQVHSILYDLDLTLMEQ